MKTILLRPWEARAAAEGRLLMLARPMKPQPEPGSGGWWYPCAFGSESYHYTSDEHATRGIPRDFKGPFGAPGDVLLCKESWSPRVRVRDPYYLPADYPDEALGAWYWADGNPDYGDWERPRSSACMPKWAVRFRPIVEAVACKRCAEMNRDVRRKIGHEFWENAERQWAQDFPRHPWPDSWAWLATLRWEGR